MIEDLKILGGGMSPVRYPHRYRLYGVGVASEIPLGALPKYQGARILVRLSVDGSTNASWPSSDGIDWYHDIVLSEREGKALSFARAGVRFLVRVHGCADFLISSSGKTVVCRPKKGILEEHLQAFFLTQILPLCLAQAGYQVLHASATVIENKAVAFLGNHSQGKSTLSAAFLSSGYSLLSDDSLPLSFGANSGNSVQAVPSFPEVRLGTKAARVLFPESIASKSSNLPLKQRIVVERLFCKRKMPLDTLYLLEESKGKAQKFEVKQAEQGESLKALLASSFRLDILNRRRMADELECLSRLLSNVRVRRLYYPRVYKKLPEVVAGIVVDVKEQYEFRGV